MFELSRNPKFAISVDKHFVECALSQVRSVPTDRQTLSMRRYPRVDTRRKGPGALWVHPLTGARSQASQIWETAKEAPFTFDCCYLYANIHEHQQG